MRNELLDVNIEGATIKYHNFSGIGSAYNREGNRNITLELPENIALDMIQQGWNVIQKGGEDDDHPVWYKLDVAIELDNKYFPTKIVKINTRNVARFLNEKTINCLDSADIVNVDITIRDRYWEVGNKSGHKAVLKALYVTVQDDFFEGKYSNVLDNMAENEDTEVPFN